MADDRDAEILQIFGRQARQKVAVDRVIAEGRFVSLETEILEPGRDVHGRLHSARWDNRLRPVVCKASTNSGGGQTAMSVDGEPNAFNLRPLSCAYRPFTGPVPKRSNGWNLPVR